MPSSRRPGRLSEARVLPLRPAIDGHFALELATTITGRVVVCPKEEFSGLLSRKIGRSITKIRPRRKNIFWYIRDAIRRVRLRNDLVGLRDELVKKRIRPAIRPPFIWELRV